MSLHTLANHLQSAGRGEDKVLVHMTPGEVKGLQSLAMAHGGSLTINPETGLPEAGFLRSLLPMIAGLGLSFIPGVGPMMAAGIVGGGTAIATGDLKKGIMAGLGAYGGAGLGAGLAAQGAQGAAAASTGSGVGLNAANAGTGVGVNAANAGAGVGLKAQTVFGPNVASTGTGYAGFQNPVLDAGFKNVVPTTTATSTIPTVTNASAYSPASSFNVGQNLSGIGANAPTVTSTIPMSAADKQAMIADQIGGFNVTGNVTKAYRPPSLLDLQAGARQSYPDLSTLKYGGSYSTAPGGRYFIENPLQGSSVATKAPIEVRNVPVDGRVVRTEVLPGDPALAQPQSITGPFRDRLSQMGRGLEASTKDFEGLKGLYNAMPTGSVIASGISLADAMKPEPIKAKKDKSFIRPYEFDYASTNVSGDPYSGSAERTYFNPVFTAKTPYEAPGSEYAASGGLMGYAAGGPIEQMAAMNSVGANTGYPQAGLQTPMYTNPTMQRPQATNVIAPSADAGVDSYTGEVRFARGGGTAEPQNQSSGYNYSYDPKTMQFTQTGGPGAAKPPSPEIAAFDMMKRLNKSQATGQPYDFTPSWAQNASTPNSAVSSGIAQPMAQPAPPAQPLIPNINIPTYQTPEQQLGLGGFYNYMNQQLGGYAGYAKGGVPSLRPAPMNAKMAAVDAAMEKMQTRQGLQEIQSAAMNGDFAAQAALQRMQEKESLDDLNNLGGYSDGGRLLKGPGDGVSDSIPASIGGRQPARLADGEFVVPARIVSEIGNGSTEAGARKLYAMMDRVQKARRKTVGKNQVARNTKADKLLPA